MDQSKEIRSAFNLWKRLLEMENLLWDLYHNEFMCLIKDNPSQRSSENTMDDLIPF